MAAFAALDKQQNGSVDAFKIGAFLSDNRFNANEDDIMGIIRRMDTTGDMSISFSEWQMYFEQLEKNNLGTKRMKTNRKISK